MYWGYLMRREVAFREFLVMTTIPLIIVSFSSMIYDSISLSKSRC